MQERVTWGRGVVLALVVLLADQLSKSAINHSILRGQRQQFLPGITFVNVHNYNYVDGVGFVGPEVRLLLTVIAAVALMLSVVGLYRLSRRPKRRMIGRRFTHRVVWVPIGLLLGGALGNLVDRLSEGSVTDFIKLQGSRLAFNLADLALVSGALLMLVLISAHQPGKGPVNSPVGH